MVTTLITLCAVPSAWWEEMHDHDSSQSSIYSLVRDALAIETRTEKGVNLENERARYTLCCQQIESLVLSQMQIMVNQNNLRSVLDAGNLPAYQLDASYLDILRKALHDSRTSSLASSARLGASFFAPESVQYHAQIFQELTQELHLNEAPSVQVRYDFFVKNALPNDCGVVEIQSGFLPGVEGSSYVLESPDARSSVPQARSSKSHHRPITAAATASGSIDRRDERMRNSLITQIDSAMVNSKIAVDFSNYRNDILAEVLHEFAYNAIVESGEPSEIRVLYADGSEAKPFPIRCLSSREKPDMAGAVTIRAALMSMRHLELDREVDIAWLRNSEVSKPRSLAESDYYCYSQTLEQFRELAQDFDTLVLHLYQTGFEPAVIGFYRGLIQFLQDLQNAEHTKLCKLIVYPYFLGRDSRYVEGLPWY